MSVVSSWESPDDWHLNLQKTAQGFVSGTSSGKIAHYSLEKYSEPLAANIHAHESAVNQMEMLDPHVLASVSSDGLKIWDLRTSLEKCQHLLQNAKRSKFLSVAGNAGAVAAGTELVGVDAEVHVWDLRKSADPMRSLVDSHHDDVTHLEFHASRPYLMSGSTDGYVNIYNMEEADEEEALHQVINFASVHQCTFLQPRRIGVLSHMETFGIFELNSTDYETLEEPAPHDFGDVREIWPNCEYVVHVTPRYVAFGANLACSLTIVPFDVQNEEFLLQNAVAFEGAHGEEVVRDVLVLPGSAPVLTCGEDGLIKAWEANLHIGEKGGVKLEKRKERKEKRRGKDKKEKRFKPY